MSAITALIGDIFRPAADLIDNLHTSKEEKDEAMAKLATSQAGAADRVMSFISKRVEEKVKVVVAEVRSSDKFVSRWRPTLMYTIIAILINNYLLVPWLNTFWGGAPVVELPDKVWTLLEIGLGGYVVGRSIEKGVAVWKNGR